MENMSRKEMCMMLSEMGHDMQDLKSYSDEELMQMCNMDHDTMMNHDMNKSSMMENTMSRKEMCMMLSEKGHDMEDLKSYSDEELMQMCNDMDKNMDYGMMENQSTTVNYMFFANLRSIKRLVDEMLLQDEHTVDEMLTNGHSWAVDHIATSKDDVEEVYGFLMDRAKKPMMDHTDDMNHHMEKLNIIKSWKNFR